MIMEGEAPMRWQRQRTHPSAVTPPGSGKGRHRAGTSTLRPPHKPPLTPSSQKLCLSSCLSRLRGRGRACAGLPTTALTPPPPVVMPIPPLCAGWGRGAKRALGRRRPGSGAVPPGAGCHLRAAVAQRVGHSDDSSSSGDNTGGSTERPWWCRRFGGSTSGSGGWSECCCGDRVDVRCRKIGSGHQARHAGGWVGRRALCSRLVLTMGQPRRQTGQSPMSAAKGGGVAAPRITSSPSL